MHWPSGLSVPPYNNVDSQPSHQQSSLDLANVDFSALSSLLDPSLSTEPQLISQSMPVQSQSVAPSQLLRPAPPPLPRPISTSNNLLQVPRYVQVQSSNSPSAQHYELYGQPPLPIIMSAYRLGQAYLPYGPIYQLGSDPKAERYYWTLFRADQQQFWMSPRYFKGVPAQPEPSQSLQSNKPNQQAQAATPKKKTSRRQTPGQPRFVLPAAPLPSTSLPFLPLLSLSLPFLDTSLPPKDTELPRVATHIPQSPRPSTAKSNVSTELAAATPSIPPLPTHKYPPLKLKPKPERQTSLAKEKLVAPPIARATPERRLRPPIGAAFVYPKSVPPPNLILSRRLVYSPAEVVFRRIASFLEAQDAVNFANSYRVIFAALDYQWWGDVYGELELESKDGLDVAWPTSSGWCDHCNEFQAQMTVQEPSKARLCLDCLELPALQNIRVTEGREIHNVGGKIGHTLMKLLPFQTIDKKKFHWVPHYKWVEVQVNPSKAIKTAQTSFSREPRTRSTTVEQTLPKKEAIKREPAKRAASIKANVNMLNFKNLDTDTEGPSTASTTEFIPTSHSASTTSLQASAEQSRHSNASRESRQGQISGDTPCDYDLLVNTQQLDDRRASNYSYSSLGQAMPASFLQRNVEEGQATKRRRVSEANEGMSLNSTLEQQFETIYTSLSQDNIKKEVRYNYLKTEAARAGMRLPDWGGPLSGTLAKFVNGEWTELAKQGIDINDFNGMIQHLKSGIN